jgi:hypothetical protein
MPRTSATAAKAEWISANAAKSILGVVGQSVLLRLVVLGEVRAQNLPGVPTKYHREDCRRVAQGRRESLQPVGG